MSYLGNEPPQIAGYSTQTKAAPVGSSITLDQEGTVNSILLFLDGVRQTPTTDYTVSGTTLTLTSTAPTTAVATILFLGDVADIGVPSDDAVNVAQLDTTSTGTTGQFLKKTGAGAIDWADAAADTSGIEDDIALLGFKVAVNGSLAKYNLVDQTEDAFIDTTGIDASASTDEIYDTVGKYYSGSATQPTGGTISTYTDSGTDYRAHTFLDDGVFAVVTSTITADYFMVAGGGGGGNAGNGGGAWGAGGGGGAGGFLTDTGVSLTAQNYTITVGDGGAGAGYQEADLNGATGENSIIAPVSGTTYTALGGGGGASGIGSSTGNDGGSGGGGAYSNRASGTGTAGPPLQGYDGGVNTYVDSGAAGGGGSAQGGAASAGGAMGGAGVSNSYRDGTSGTTKGTHYFAGGGSGGTYSGTGGLINIYGGGAGGIKGGTDNGTSNGSAAVAYTGGGGGGGSASVTNSASTGGAGGDGGKGIVIIRYEDTGAGGFNDMSLVSNATTAEAEPTKGDVVFTHTTAGGGSTTLNTDVKAYASRDDGTTWTLMTLEDQGNTGNHDIASAHNVDISGQPSGTAMRYKIETLNQSATKETRIQAVSLGWS